MSALLMPSDSSASHQKHKSEGKGEKKWTCSTNATWDGWCFPKAPGLGCTKAAESPTPRHRSYKEVKESYHRDSAQLHQADPLQMPGIFLKINCECLPSYPGIPLPEAGADQATKEKDTGRDVLRTYGLLPSRGGTADPVEGERVEIPAIIQPTGGEVAAERPAGNTNAAWTNEGANGHAPAPCRCSAGPEAGGQSPAAFSL
ncbi:uncharacterized protein LOC128841320 [Malaclemys terrapin pileata]|uniref:uncharacterized protein LOC128841320 n=1 Tax=Malaclemys terrapin pileata TaxID=2991368 RepID=UPI0023A80D7A|nr:uncharacterized protein LOC128841320 [Malaclemys terrapin pileata]